MTHLINLTDIYFMHLGFWVSFSIAITVYRKGLPSTKELPSLFKSATILSAILSLFSSGSHIHYLKYLIGN